MKAGQDRTFIALLRGVNVGGNNKLPMKELAAMFHAAGCVWAETYIQSGNVVFGSSGTSNAELMVRIERMLAASFDYEASVVVRSRRQMRAIVDGAPRGFGADPDRYRSDVIFVKPPLTAKAACAPGPTKEGVDRAWAGTGVLYYERLTARATQSRLSAIVSMPLYRSVTIRNWNTTTKLLRLL